jgi:hypothetical protein
MESVRVDNTKMFIVQSLIEELRHTHRILLEKRDGRKFFQR